MPTNEHLGFLESRYVRTTKKVTNPCILVLRNHHIYLVNKAQSTVNSTEKGKSLKFVL